MKHDNSVIHSNLFSMLQEEGYGNVRTDEDGQLVFQLDGSTYLFSLDNNDPGYIRLLFPNFWSIDSDDERARAMVACNQVTLDCKCASVSIGSDSVTAEVQLLLPTGGTLDGTYVRRILSMISTAVSYFMEQMSRMAMA